ncbi:hypothetical protein J1614_004480 [Plenodomus biglobosus]|nr:hypothetical protein J1614_004480 [Plenodomus biglobosus]
MMIDCQQVSIDDTPRSHSPTNPRASKTFTCKTPPQYQRSSTQHNDLGPHQTDRSSGVQSVLFSHTHYPRSTVEHSAKGILRDKAERNATWQTKRAGRDGHWRIGCHARNGVELGCNGPWVGDLHKACGLWLRPSGREHVRCRCSLVKVFVEWGMFLENDLEVVELAANTLVLWVRRNSFLSDRFHNKESMFSLTYRVQCVEYSDQPLPQLTCIECLEETSERAKKPETRKFGPSLALSTICVGNKEWLLSFNRSFADYSHGDNWPSE